MVTEWLGIEDSVLGTFIFLMVSGYSLYLVVAFIAYLLYFKWGRSKFNPGYQPDWTVNRDAMKWGFYSISGNAVVTAPIHVLIATGTSKVYFDVSEHGWAWIAVSAVLMLFVTETLVYWAHRILHTKLFWSWFHKYHHKWKRPTPFVAVAFHPVDSFMQALPHHLCAFLFPVHVYVYLASVTLVTVWSVIIHDRVTLLPIKFVNYTDHHTIHHLYDDHNYGQYTTLWDQACGTYRSPKTTEF